MKIRYFLLKIVFTFLSGLFWFFFLFKEVLSDDVGSTYRAECSIFLLLGVLSFIFVFLSPLAVLLKSNCFLVGVIFHLGIGLIASISLRSDWGMDFFPVFPKMGK